MGEGLEEVPYVNPFPPLTDAWAVHDTVLEILAVLSDPTPEGGYQREMVDNFKTWFNFIGATLDLSVLEVKQVFQHILYDPMGDGDAFEITDRLLDARLA